MEKDQVIEIDSKEAVQAIKSVEGSSIHCFMGFVGADWDKKSVIALAKKSKRIAWADNMFAHNLVIINEGRQHCFDIKYPTPA